MRLAKDRLAGTGWPSRIPMDAVVKNSVLKGPTSTNEAYLLARLPGNKLHSVTKGLIASIPS